jgi:hypothetical protein
MVTEMAKGVYWVGVVDWGIRHFHGYELSTHRGTSYNAYLILDEHAVLVDTVWDPFQDQLLENIREAPCFRATAEACISEAREGHQPNRSAAAQAVSGKYRIDSFLNSVTEKRTA